MDEIPRTEVNATSEQSPINWLRIIRFPVALFAAAVTPVVAFVPLVGIFSFITILFDAISSNNINYETFSNATFGGVFLAFYVSFYVPCLSFPCVIVFGIPISIIASRLNLIQKWNCGLAGFFLGSVPGGLFFYNSYSNGSSFANGVHYWINGTPTLAGLIQLAGLILLSGILGAVGGFSFWYIWQLFSKYEIKNSPIP